MLHGDAGWLSPCSKDFGVLRFSPRDLNFTSHRFLRSLRMSSPSAVLILRHEPWDVAASVGQDGHWATLPGMRHRALWRYFSPMAAWAPPSRLRLLFCQTSSLYHSGSGARPACPLAIATFPSCFLPAVSLMICQQVKSIWGFQCLHSSPQNLVVPKREWPL
uniref:Uncharacterized protein n=1 Tax=Mandrillus leucophaeus TaxID=9568 RepID=A0A2K5YQJ7_MANLE